MYAPDETTDDNRIAPGHACASTFPGMGLRAAGGITFSR